MCTNSKLNFTCENCENHLPISSCDMLISSDIMVTPSQDTMSFEIQINNETVVTTDLLVYPSKDKELFSGKEQCPTPSKPVDLLPVSQRCGVTMMVIGEKNPFWFDYVPP